MLEQLLKRALEERKRGEPVTLAVIADAHGSTPRTTGAAMLVGRDGLLAGTIGGGELEYQCVRMALAPERPLMEFTLNNQQAASLGMVCGGSARVLFVPLTDVDLLEQALECLRQMEPACLLLPLAGGAPELAWEDILAPGQVCREGRDFLELPLAEPGRIFLLGGGHVSLALSKLLDVLGYPYLVVDDRQEFADPQRFPNARRTWAAEFSQLADVLAGALRPNRRDCVCIMTRGHLADTDALRFALKTEAGYIGVMGSRRKREQVFAQLTAEGFADVARRVVTPIGLPIGGETPEELAVSISAQLVQFRYQET